MKDLKDVKGTEYEIIVLKETWVSEERLEHFDIDWLHNIYSTQIWYMRSGGVVVYVKDHLNVTYLQKFERNAFTAIKMQIIMGKQQNLSVLLLYRNCKASKMKFTQDLEGVIGNKAENQIILGDVNIILFDSVQSAEYQNLLVSLGYISLST